MREFKSYATKGIEHRTLKALYEGITLGSDELLAIVKAEALSLADYVTDTLAAMAMAGMVLPVDRDWQLTTAGAACLNFLEAKAKMQAPRPLTVAAKKIYTPRNGDYAGTELQATVARKGAYDFLGLPSRFGDELISHPTSYLAQQGERNDH